MKGKRWGKMVLKRDEVGRRGREKRYGRKKRWAKEKRWGREKRGVRKNWWSRRCGVEEIETKTI